MTSFVSSTLPADRHGRQRLTDRRTTFAKTSRLSGGTWGFEQALPPQALEATLRLACLWVSK